MIPVIIIRGLTATDRPALRRIALDRAKSAAVISLHNGNALNSSGSFVGIRLFPEFFPAGMNQVLRAAISALHYIALPIPMQCCSALLTFQIDHGFLP